MKELLHTNDTNKAESINSFVTMFYPKNRHLCRTINGFGRIAEVVIFDSMGFEAGVDCIFDELSIERSPETSMYLQERDQRRKYLSRHKKKTSVKRKRAEDKQFQMKEGKRKLLEDRLKGLEYASGIANRIKTGENAGLSTRKLTKKIHGLTCQNCRLVGHARFTSKRCPYHNDYKYSILSFLHRYEESGESWELTIFDDSLSCESCGMVGHANNESLRCPDWFGYDNVEKKWEDALTIWFESEGTSLECRCQFMNLSKKVT